MIKKSVLLFLFITSLAISQTTTTTQYSQLQQNLCKGWNTWNIHSVLSHVLLPQGIAINLGIKEYADGSYLKEALIGRSGNDQEEILPGPRSYDGSYSELIIKWQKIELKIQSAARGDTLVLLITPLENQFKPASLIAEGGLLWGRPGYVVREKNVLKWHTDHKEIQLYSTVTPVTETNINANTPYLALPLENEIGLSTAGMVSLPEIKDYINQARKKVIEQENSFAADKDIYIPMHRTLAWNLIYDPENNRVIIPISRNWYWGGFVLFDWDTYFSAYMLSVDSKELAYANAVEVTHGIAPDGFIPNFSAGRGLKSLDRSQPPVGSFVIRELYKKFKDKWLLDEVYDELLSWNRWWFKARLNGNLLSWGSNPYKPVTGNWTEIEDINNLQGAAFESGLDNSPMWDDVPFDTVNHYMKLHAVDLNSFYILDCQALAEIAEVLRKKDDAQEIRERQHKIESGLKQLWDEKTGLFLNKRTDNNTFSKRLTPVNFYPLFTGIPTQKQAERMIREHYFNPDEFFGEWVIPSVARNDPAFADNNYWRGRIWAPLNFLVYIGLRRYDLPEARKDLAEKSRKLIEKEWLEKGHIHENYNATSGEGCDALYSDKFYHWGALLSMIVLLEDGVEQIDLK